MCRSYIDVYAPLAFGMLAQYLNNPATLCAAIGMCPPAVTSAALKQGHEMAGVKTAVAAFFNGAQGRVAQSMGARGGAWGGSRRQLLHTI